MSNLPLAALVLVGGYGTRLRPLTFSKSKPLIEFCNRPMVSYMLDSLRDVGCKKIIFALSELQNDLVEFIDSYQKKNPSIKIIPSVEQVAMGTAGPIALAKEHLQGHRFFVLNSDVISRYPFQQLLDVHLKSGGEGTIMSWDVEDPSRFGVIISDEKGKILKFVEKPTVFVGRSINAGHYVFEPTILDRIPLRPTSIERETFPEMVTEGKLFVTPLTGFWADIGTPSSFLNAVGFFLENEQKVLIGQNVIIGNNAKIGPNVVIGDNVKIGDDCIFENSVVFEKSVIGNTVLVKNSIIGWNNIIGSKSIIEDLCIFDDGVSVGENLHLKKVVVCSHRSVNKSYLEEKIIL